MAYSTSAPPRLIGDSLGTTSPNIWMYASTDAATAVRVSGYFTNGYNLGMRAGDLVISVKTDASPVSLQLHVVNVSGTTVDLSDGLAVTATNTD